ncbi:MAG: hypothetical protein KatS3mg104_2605 [Phycisphaerae bacterium]|jgi:4-amino-4-deoxy-L-arabinose transferase-like glycosyltransferase|nr:MAG: hypothetical protein KatS3mg104_2605 [Phycisphaerae bacterium]
MPLRDHVLIWLYGLVLLVVPLNDGTVLSRHEVYVCQPARELLEGQMPWAIQTFAGEYRLNKPPAMSWLVAGSMKLFGSREEWVCRLPSAIAGIITAWATAMIASRLFKHPVSGLLTGLICLTMVWLQIQSKLAQADMPMVACVALALLGLARQPPEQGQPRSVTTGAVLFWLGTSGAFLLKMVGIFITIPAALVLAFWAKDPRARRVLRHPVGLTIFLVVLIAWPLAAYWTYPPIIHVWSDQTLDRLVGDITQDNRPPVTTIQYLSEFFYYFWTIPWLVLPATPAIVIGLWTGFDRYKSFPGKYLLAWFVPFLILLTLGAIKYKHYCYPLLPALAVVGDYGTTVWIRSLKRPHLAKPLLVAWFVGCAGVILWLKVSIIPRSDGNRGYAELASQANALVPTGQRIYMVGLGEQPIAFYLEPIPKRIDRISDIPSDQTLLAVTRSSLLEKIQTTHPVTTLLTSTRSKPSDDPLVVVKIN